MGSRTSDENRAKCLAVGSLFPHPCISIHISFVVVIVLNHFVQSIPFVLVYTTSVYYTNSSYVITQWGTCFIHSDSVLIH